jgi:hypothetical protein
LNFCEYLNQKMIHIINKTKGTVPGPFWPKAWRGRLGSGLTRRSVGALGAGTTLEVAVAARSPMSHRWPRHGKVLPARASRVRGIRQA